MLVQKGQVARQVMPELEIQEIQEEVAEEEEEVLVATATGQQIQELREVKEEVPVEVLEEVEKVMQMNHFLSILVVLGQVVLLELQIQEVLGDLETLDLVEILEHLLLL